MGICMLKSKEKNENNAQNMIRQWNSPFSPYFEEIFSMKIQ